MLDFNQALKNTFFFFKQGYYTSVLVKYTFAAEDIYQTALQCISKLMISVYLKQTGLCWKL